MKSELGVMGLGVMELRVTELGVTKPGQMDQDDVARRMELG